MNLRIQPPIAGTVRSMELQEQQPHSSPDMVNFVPFSPRDGRAVFSARPFLTNFTSPGVGVNLLEAMSGDRPSNPTETVVLARNGAVSVWDGSAWDAATIDSGEAITTGRPVFGAPFFNKLFIANDAADGGMLEYDYELNTLSTPSATAGSFPADARVVATHMGTLWAGGSAEDGHVLRGSKTGDFYDWDFTDTSDAAPFQTTGENAGLLNEPITALIPMASDVMVVAGKSSLFTILGHPSRGGIFFPLSRAIGVLGQGAWCKTDDNRVFAMSHKGLIQLTSDGDGTVALVSEERLPKALKGIPYTRLSPTISMAYDTQYNGVHIIINDPDTPQAWWYDMKTGGFFRQSYGDTLPTRLLQFDEIASFSASGVLYGGEGYGGLARWTAAGPEFSRPQAWSFLGPVRIHGQAGPQTTGVISRAKLTLSNDTDGDQGTLSIFTGTDGEDAFLRAYNAVMGSGFAAANFNLTRNNGVCFPRLKGAVMVAVIGDGGTGTYGFESLDLEVNPRGRNRQQKVSGLTYDLEFGLDGYDPEYNLAAVTGYVEVAAQVTLDDTVTDAPNFINLSRLPSRWWRGLSENTGYEIIATDASNNRLPMHLVWFNRSGREGMAAVNLTQDGTETIRLWTKTTLQGSLPAVGDTYGQYAAYPSWMTILWALGGGVDVTSSQIDNTALTALVDSTDENPFGFRVSQITTSGTKSASASISNPSGNVGLAFISKQVDQTNQGMSVAITGTGSNVEIIRDYQNDEVLGGAGGDFVIDDTLWPASPYFEDWAFLGMIFDPTGDDVYVSTPVLEFSEGSATGGHPTGSTALRFLANAPTVITREFAMIQMLDATDLTGTLAYYQMMHSINDGEFYQYSQLIPADESDISE